MQDFEIKGEYTHAGSRGEFVGALRVYDDDRVVGTMNDSGADIIFNKGETKLVIGVKEGYDLNFWKISPSPITVPLVYAMTDSYGLATSKPDVIFYEGKWIPIEIPVKSLIRGVEGNAGLREIDDALKSNSLEQTLDTLGRIEKSRIQSYLDQNLIRDIKALSQETGYLTLTRVESFSA
ncbi:MAG: hypothetical protein AABX66_03620 [Nanoarchaeota archaeon]